MRSSIIIPVLNEEKAIEGCLEQFRDAEGIETIVVDGGSCDRTREAVEAYGFARFVRSPRPGLGFQMNRGAKAASGDVLLFLHADTFLPADGLRMIRCSLRNPKAVGGRFRLGFSEATRAFRLIVVFSTLRSRYLRITYGDQGIYVRRSVFERVGGFPLLRIFGDSEFCSTVSELGRFVLLGAEVRTSTRRWRSDGIFRTVIWMWILRLLYLCSVPNDRLCRLYRDVR